MPEGAHLPHVAPPHLIGRAAEQEALEALVAAARRGRSGAIVVLGDPGMGKTSLLDHVATAADDMAVLAVAGVESESTLAFGALHRLLLPVFPRVMGLPLQQRDALLVAVGTMPGAGPNRLVVGMGLLRLLSELAADRPVLVVIDDVQWLDDESLAAFTFVARRLHAEGIAAVLAVRPSSQRADAVADLPGITLAGLTDAEAVDLFRRAARCAPADAVAARVVEEAGGCPLALIEIAHQLTPAQLAGTVPLPALLPLGQRMEAHFLRRVRALPAAAQTMLLVLAADTAGDNAARRAVLHELQIAEAAADAAVDAGLLDAGPGISFRHPLVRSAVYAGAPRSTRRRVHAAFAAATDATRQPDRHAWHLAAAAVGPDEAVAATIERAATSVRGRGALVACAELLARAAELSPSAATASRRRLAAARVAADAGAVARAAVLIDSARTNIDDPHQAARAEWLEGSLAVARWRPGTGPAPLRDAALALAGFDVVESNEARLDAVDAFLAGGRCSPGVTTEGIGVLARDGAATSDGIVGSLLQAFGALFGGPFDAAVPHLRRALDSCLDPGLPDRDRARFAHFAIVLAEELWDTAALAEVVARLEPIVREQGLLVPMIGLRTAGAALAMRAGRFDRAAVEYERGIDVIRVAGGASGRAGHLDIQLRAWRGDAGTAEAARAQIDGSLALGSGVAADRAWFSLAVYELGRADYAAALDAALQIADSPLTWGNHALALVVESASRAGAPDQAAATLATLRSRAVAAGTSWALGLLARSEALLAVGDDAEAHHQDALDRFADRTLRLELARSHLLYGEWLRRRKRRLDARAQLHLAHDLFTEFGAMGFAARARRELIATGGRARARHAGTSGTLTAQERVVAELAATGATNQEIATQLFLSASTVDYHLGKVYRKLGVSSRRALRQIFASSPAQHLATARQRQ